MKQSSSAVSGSDKESLAATAETPMLGVHVLTEFIFCPRAGLLAYETEREDRGEDGDAAPQLDFTPDYEIRAIEEGLQESWTRIWRFVTWLPVILIVLAVVGLFYSASVACVLAVPLVFFCRWFVGQVGSVIVLSKRLSIAKAAQPREPRVDIQVSQEVNWWDLLACGFAPVEYQHALVDNDWRLSGKPWRVLQKGSLRIPVFRKRHGDRMLYPQHFARMAAYCHLVETCEGAESPYGIILFAGSYDGVTLPKTAKSEKLFHDGLRRAREIIHARMHSHTLPEPPRNPGLCRECPWGFPWYHVAGQHQTICLGVPIAPFLTRAKNGKLFHSACGDRFQWVPPHRNAKAAPNGSEDLCGQIF